MTLKSEAVDALNNGLAQCKTLTECLAVDQSHLARAVLPKSAAKLFPAIDAAAKLGILKRMQTIGSVLRDQFGEEAFLEGYQGHVSDTVRGWACFVIGANDIDSLEEKLARISPLADDTHFGVREWAWVALRPHLMQDIDHSIELLTKWTASPSERIRRFASESLRPRGVWCPHIPSLKKDPSPGLALLNPLRADMSTYVQDSVSNWLNDAGKTSPEWVIEVCKKWQLKNPSPATQRICNRALRNLR